MQDLAWSRSKVLEQVSSEIWKYLSPSSTPEELRLLGSSMLQLDEFDLAKLARVHFLFSAEVGILLDVVPELLRRLPTVTVSEDERSTVRVRGSINWPATFGARATGDSPILFVTRPVERAYETPEGQLLVFLLEQVRRLGLQSNWSDSQSPEAGLVISYRTAQAARWLQHRMLGGIPVEAPSFRAIARIRSGRHRRRFQPALDAFEVYQDLVAHLDVAAIKDIVERRGLVVVSNPTLFELWNLFLVLGGLTECGWALAPMGVVEGNLWLPGVLDDAQIDVWYQHTPKKLRTASQYVEHLKTHRFVSVGDLLPDIVIRANRNDITRWLIVESKMGTKYGVGTYARRALKDLLTYRQSYSEVLELADGPYGLGIALGRGLHPEFGDLMLCTPDYVGEAMNLFSRSVFGPDFPI